MSNANMVTKIAEDAIRLGLSDIEQMVSEMIKPSKEQVVAAAHKFLQAYEKSQNIYNSELQRLSQKASKRLRNTIELAHARQAFDEFQNAINAYYGQLVKVMYAYLDPQSGQITLSLRNNDTSVLQVSDQYGAVQYWLNEIDNVFELDDYDATLLDATQQSIYARWNIAKAHAKKKHKSRMLPILWQIHNVWSGALVNNLGTIAEAYVNFYLSKYAFSSSLEHDVATFILHKQLGAIAVDNASGFLIGDASILDGQVQLAVKKQTASPANMKTVYEFTRNIINSPDLLPQQLAARFKTQELENAQHNQVVRKLAHEIDNTYNSLINDLEKHLTK